MHTHTHTRNEKKNGKEIQSHLLPEDPIRSFQNSRGISDSHLRPRKKNDTLLYSIVVVPQDTVTVPTSGETHDLIKEK